MTTENSSRPNVVWLILDSIRQDHTTMGGYERETTPKIDRIASMPAGQSFDRCFATAKWSLPSVASMLTGTYPAYHRMDSQAEVLPEGIDTVAEVLSRAGYSTSGLSINPYFAETTGLDRGFEWFRSITAENFLSAAGPRALGKYALNIREQSGGFTPDKRKHRPEYLLNDIAKRRLSTLAEGEEPFLFVGHYQGAHHPYYPPDPYVDLFTDDLGMTPERAREVAFDRTTDVFYEMANSESFSPGEWRAIHAMYDSLVRFSDDATGALFAHLSALDLLEDTIFVVTADHGDLLGEYGLLSHKLVLHDALTHVPMVVHGAEELVGHGDELVQHTDLIRTLVEIAGGDTAGFQGKDVRNESREYAISQHLSGLGTALDTLQSHNPEFDRSRFHESALSAVRSTAFKYLQSEDRSELFCLPDETEDVSETYPERVSEFETFFAEWLETHSRAEDSAGRKAEFSESVKGQLADLGYITD